MTQLETPYDVTSYALRKAKEFGCQTIFNPAPASKIEIEDFNNIDFFTPNENEAGYYLNQKIETEKDIENASSELINKGVKNVIITLGSKGAFFRSQNESFFVKALILKDDVIDTTGAGDAFAAGFLAGYTRGCDLPTSARMANIAAGEAISHLGARPEACLADMGVERMGRNLR